MHRRSFLKTAGLAAGAAAAFPAPALSQGRIDWKMVTAWPKNFPGLGTGAQRLANRIAALTDGRFSVTVYPADELVPVFECFDAVAAGRVEMYYGAEALWSGRHPAFAFFEGVPMGLTADEMNGWILHGGGQELWDQLAGGFGVKPFLAGNTGATMAGWFRSELPDDGTLTGLKIRMPGLGGEVLSEVGATVVAVPAGETFAALQSGAVDAAAWGGPWADLQFGFYRVAPFYYYPGFQEPSATVSCGINRAKFDALSAADRAAVEAACLAENNVLLAEHVAKNGQALPTLTGQHGVRLVPLPAPLMDRIADASASVVGRIGEHDSTAKRIFESYRKVRRESAGWTTISDEAFSAARDRLLGKQ